MWTKNMSSEEAAAVVERFLEDRSLYPQEWNDFVETPQNDRVVEGYRRQCYELDALVNRPGDVDSKAVEQLKSIIKSLRS